MDSRPDLEHVPADDVLVGDYVDVTRPVGGAHRVACVIAKARARAAQDRIGWLVAFADGETAWWPRCARVWRRRSGETGGRPWP